MNRKSTTSKMIFQSLFVKIQLDPSVWNWNCRKSVWGPGELKALQMKWTVVFKHACCNCLETLQTFEELHNSVNQNFTSNERGWSYKTGAWVQGPWEVEGKKIGAYFYQISHRKQTLWKCHLLTSVAYFYHDHISKQVHILKWVFII